MRIAESLSVVSDSLQPHELYGPWNSPGQNTGVGSLSLLQGIFPTQGSNPGLPHCRQILYQLGHQGSLKWEFQSVQFSRSVMSDSLWPHGMQHARPPCPSLTPRVYSNSCPLSRWCHPTISSSVVTFSSCLQSFPASGSFQGVSSYNQVAKVLDIQLQHQSFQWIFKTDFLYNGLVGSPCSPRDSQQSSPIPQFKNIKSSALSFIVQLSHPYMTTGKTIALTKQAFVNKIMSLLFNMLSRLVIAFLPRSKCLLILWLHLPSAVVLEPKKIKSVTVSIVSPSICHEVMEPDAMILVFWMLSFKPVLSLSSFNYCGILAHISR